MTTEEMAYFHTRYDLLVRAVSRRICLPKDCREVLYLDTFAKVFRRTRPVFPDASDEKNWLIGICVSVYREMLRYRKRRELLPVFMRDPPSIPDSAPDQSIHPLNQLLQDEKERQVMDRVCRLPEKNRLPIILFCFLDRQTSEVASVLHISQRAVLARLHRGRAVLADHLLDETLHSSLQWHEAEKHAEEDAAFKKVAQLAHPAPTGIERPAVQIERRRNYRRRILAVSIPLVLILIGALSFSRPGEKQTPESVRPAFSDYLGSADAYAYPVTPEKTPEVWKTLGSHDAMIEVFQIPESLLWSMSTEGLVETCLNYPMTGEMMLFNSPTGWVDGVIKNFNGLQKLLQRKDAGFELLRVYQRVDYGALCKSGLIPNAQFAFLTLLLAQDRILDQMGQRLRLELLKSVALNGDLVGNPLQDFHALYVASHGVLVGKILLLDTPELAAELLAQYPNWKRLIETGQFMSVSPEEWKDISRLFNHAASPVMRGNDNPEEELLTRLAFERLLEQESFLPMQDLRPSNWALLGVRPISYQFKKLSGVTLTLFVCSSKEQQEELYDNYALTSTMTDRQYPPRYYGVKNLFIILPYSSPNEVYSMSRLERAIIRIALNG